ncbi:MAG: MupA/Atu3671 family FMN-dependent luciferase-like monooxygenase, partial [Blastocatellia bacterium]
SVVLPLHNPLRVAEEWSVVDNLSHGRVGISFASGWAARDFALAPGQYPDRKSLMFDQIKTVQRLWRGESINCLDGNGKQITLAVMPRPVQAELPVWITAAGNPETFRLAGEMGANLLTHLLGQTVEDLAEKIAVYRRSWRKPEGYSIGSKGGGHVTLMLHTFIGEDMDVVREQVREPFCRYLRSSLDLLDNLGRSMGVDVRASDFTESDFAALLGHAFDRYFASSGLMGTPASCLPMIEQLKDVGVDEVGCLIDFGVDVDLVMSSLRLLKRVMNDSNECDLRIVPAAHLSLAQQVITEGVSHLQCTPSLAKILLAEAEGNGLLGSIRKLLIGGEGFPISLAEQCHEAVGADIHNMYGPTETTIWSTTHRVDPSQKSIPIGKPIANTEIYLSDCWG